MPYSRLSNGGFWAALNLIHSWEGGRSLNQWTLMNHQWINRNKSRDVSRLAPKAHYAPLQPTWTMLCINDLLYFIGDLGLLFIVLALTGLELGVAILQAHVSTISICIYYSGGSSYRRTRNRKPFLSVPICEEFSLWEWVCPLSSWSIEKKWRTSANNSSQKKGLIEPGLLINTKTNTNIIENTNITKKICLFYILFLVLLLPWASHNWSDHIDIPDDDEGYRADATGDREPQGHKVPWKRRSLCKVGLLITN